MIQIRRCIFETNSSSTHTMTITDNKTYEKWIKGELLYINEDEVWCLRDIDSNLETENFISKERAIDLYKQIVKEKYPPNFEDIFKTFTQWIDYCDELYNYEEEYTTKNGEKIIVFGKYGYQG